MNSLKNRALVVFSGGLDSILAVKILQGAGCEVAALTFESPFFGSEKAKVAAKNLGIEIFIEDFSTAIFGLVKDPPHGLGKNMNPCLDCHAAMFRRAADFASKNNFQIIASGEVLGQRPFSQNRDALGRVIKIAGTEILRPLTAKNLPETEFEKSGLIDREKLFDFSGRSRRPQIALAQELKISDFPSPAGGCLLTEPGFADRLKILLDRDPAATIQDANLLKTGRFITLGEKSFAMLGRNSAENEKLEALENSKNYLIKMVDFAGPTAVLSMKKPDEFEKLFELVAAEMRRRGRDSKNFIGKTPFEIAGQISEVREG